MPRDILKIRACPYCGSMDTWPALLFGGPIPWIDHNDGGYICRNCGKQAVPLDFDSLEDLKTYQREITKEKAAPLNKGFLHIPMVPVDTTSLFSIPGTDLSFLQAAEVVDIKWDGKRLINNDSRSPFLRYRRAVRGEQYNAQELLMLDLSGIREGRPNFDALKELIKRKYDVWLDLGMESLQDLFDSFAMDVSKAIAGTMSAPHLEHFEEPFELSDRVVPCIQLDREVVWRKRNGGPRELEEVVKALQNIGYEEMGVIDLSRLGTRSGVSPDLIERLQAFDGRFYIGGGVVEPDLDKIRNAGLAGAFMDPFTPIISGIIEHEEEVTVATFDSPVEKRNKHPNASPTY